MTLEELFGQLLQAQAKTDEQIKELIQRLNAATVQRLDAASVTASRLPMRSLADALRNKWGAIADHTK